jgi:GH25 family lysozyme M1 (1,4-beta-N-acetylmuramidase)
MDYPYQLLVDVWEGNTSLDPETLCDAGVTGMIVRLNDMNGGHHMDARFDDNWETAQFFPCQTVYFVYNPWVTGSQNYDWLMDHLPWDFGKRRVMVDIEVTYPGYSPLVYRQQVNEFLHLVSLTNPVAVYTGGWFLDRLDAWPINVDYWWAAYSTPLQLCKSWENYKQSLHLTNMQDFIKKSPGPVRLWQATGDGCILPGFGGHAVDISVFPGNLEDLQIWFGMNNNGGTKTMGTFSGNAKLTWFDDGNAPETIDLTGYDGAVIWLGDGDNMNPIADKQLNVVYQQGKPALGFYTWEFDYTANMSFNQIAWPSAANDPYMQKLTRAMMSGTVQRKYSGLMIDVSNTKQTDTVSLSDQWVRDFAIKHLTDMIWKAFRIPVYIYFTPAAYKQYKSHAGDTNLPAFMQGIQPDDALSTLVWAAVDANNYPVDSSSPVIIKNSDGTDAKDANGNKLLVMDTGYWKFWLYASKPRLTWLFTGTKTALNIELGFNPASSTTPPPTTDPGTTPPPADPTGLDNRVSALETWKDDFMAKLHSL